jgi:hypothetical protein
MKILSREIKANEKTFSPEMIITMSFPMKLIKEGGREIEKCIFTEKDFMKAWEEYENERR